MKNTPTVRYDQGLFNLTCSLVKEISARSHLNFLCELDATGMDEIRHQARVTGQTPPTYTAFVIKAAAMALQSHPHLNCMIQERPFSTRLVPLKDVTATVAVERIVDGLDMVFAPSMKNPAQRSLTDLTQQLRGFATVDPSEPIEFKRLSNSIPWARYFPSIIGRMFQCPSLSPLLWTKFRGGSFAVTSPGKYGGCDQVLPPWPWPMTFSFGAIKMRPFVVKREVIARKTMRLTLTVDRRLAHGAPLARFAEHVRILLENPEQIWRSPNDASPLVKKKANTTPVSCVTGS